MKNMILLSPVMTFIMNATAITVYWFGGQQVLGKTIIFAQTKKHAQFIIERFDALYPELKGGFAKRVICDDSYSHTIIKEFKKDCINRLI